MSQFSEPAIFSQPKLGRLRTPKSSIRISSSPSSSWPRRQSIASSSSWDTGLSSQCSDISFQCPLTPTSTSHSPTTPYAPDGRDVWQTHDLNLNLTVNDLDSQWTLDDTQLNCLPTTLSADTFDAAQFSEINPALWEEVAQCTPSSGVDVPFTTAMREPQQCDVNQLQQLSDFSSPIMDQQAALVKPHQMYTDNVSEGSPLESDMTMSTSATGSSFTMEDAIESPTTSSPSYSPREGTVVRPIRKVRSMKSLDRPGPRSVPGKVRHSKRRPWHEHVSQMKKGSFQCDWVEPHTGKPCESKPFKRPEHLKRHKYTHTGEQPYQCRGCGRRFGRSDNWKVHERNHAKEDNKKGRTRYIPWMAEEDFAC
ncbi:MAG: hypothetical protein M1833_002070 [Piccolia ochrophora]|nr:MAG: hypothetical protein M1833_002070 [Piccolia ochrophora]